MFIDASALCAMLAHEPDALSLTSRMEGAPKRLSSPTAVWEAVVALTKLTPASLNDAHGAVMEFFREADIELVPIPPEAAALAVQAHDRFGKGRHPAGLNFGDCFAYACARHFGVPLLFKGNDFSRTDIEAA